MGVIQAVPATWPDTARARDAFVLSRRSARTPRDPWAPPRVLVEDERAADGAVVRSATIFLTGRECPWRCVMCDLWTQTIAEDTPRGALPLQVRRALAGLRPRPAQAKLYNAGSFFDPRAVPESDCVPIARELDGVAHVVVESHPQLVGPRLLRWRDALEGSASGPPPSVEVAIGLETAHPTALERLHKRFTLDDFARAADRVRHAGASLRVFLLVGVPFIPRAAQLEWLVRSVSYAFEHGAAVVSLIPTRGGNGAMEALAAAGLFEPPRLEDVEEAFEVALANAAGRVFVDLWDLQAFASCAVCRDDRRARLHTMNLTQRPQPPVSCAACATGGGRR